MTERITHLAIMASVCTHLPNEEAATNFWVESLTLSLKSLADNWASFNIAIDEKNVKNLGHFAHKLNGTVSFVGATHLSIMLLDLQTKCDEDRVEWPIAGASDFNTMIAQVKKELEESKSQDYRQFL